MCEVGPRTFKGSKIQSTKELNSKYLSNQVQSYLRERKTNRQSPDQ